MTEEIMKNANENSLEVEMRKYGIERVPVDYFHVDGFRYSNMKDAVAQAKRTEAKQ
jgi:hypothetical protein